MLLGIYIKKTKAAAHGNDDTKEDNKNIDKNALESAIKETTENNLKLMKALLKLKTLVPLLECLSFENIS